MVNRGSGIYGPYGQPIVSPSGGVLRFNAGRRNSGVRGVGRDRLTGRFTGSSYAMSVHGQKPTLLLDRALARISLKDFDTAGSGEVGRTWELWCRTSG